MIDPQTLLHKHNDARRRHIGKLKFKVTNWPEHEAGLRPRASVMLWTTSEAIVAGAEAGDCQFWWEFEPLFRFAVIH